MSISDMSDDEIEMAAMKIVGELLDTFGTELTHVVLACGHTAVSIGLKKHEFTDADRVEMLEREARLTARVRASAESYLLARGDWEPSS